jgi:DNA helicase-2/ATP-dependent DNA helicase PcrA
LALNQIDQSGAFAVSVRNKIDKLRDSPYFARIDFTPQDEQEALTYYIGRFGFAHENQMLIFDWRAPIASMFYNCEIGPAGYDAPVGRWKVD